MTRVPGRIHDTGHGRCRRQTCHGKGMNPAGPANTRRSPRPLALTALVVSALLSVAIGAGVTAMQAAHGRTLADTPVWFQIAAGTGALVLLLAWAAGVIAAVWSVVRWRELRAPAVALTTGLAAAPVGIALMIGAILIAAFAVGAV